MPTVRITSNLDELARDLETVKGSVPELLNDTIHEFGHTVFYYSQEWVPVRTGNLKRSGFDDDTQPMLSVVGYVAPYAADVEYGTKPHIIAPKNKPFLAWKPLVGKFRSFGGKKSRNVYGQWVYTKKPVHHPGTPAKAYMRNSVAYSMLHIRDIASAVFDKYISRIRG